MGSLEIGNLALIIQGISTILNGITNTWFNPNLTEIVKHIREEP